MALNPNHRNRALPGRHRICCRGRALFRHTVQPGQVHAHPRAQGQRPFRRCMGQDLCFPQGWQGHVWLRRRLLEGHRPGKRRALQQNWLRGSLCRVRPGAEGDGGLDQGGRLRRPRHLLIARAYGNRPRGTPQQLGIACRQAEQCPADGLCAWQAGSQILHGMRLRTHARSLFCLRGRCSVCTVVL